MSHPLLLCRFRNPWRSTGGLSKGFWLQKIVKEENDPDISDDEFGDFGVKPTEHESDDEIIESDIELEGETVEPDNDSPQKMGDPSIEVTEENRDASQIAKGQAMEAISEGKLDEAIEKLTEAISLNPSAIMLAARATVYIKMKKPNAAIRDADAALLINPDSAKGYKARGMALAMLGKWEEAAKDLHLASKLDFDEELSAILKKVEPNAHKIEEHRRKYDRLRKEKEQKKAERDRLRRRAEAQVNPEGGETSHPVGVHKLEETSPPPPPEQQLPVIDPLVWTALAGRNARIPAVGSRVFYIPRRHFEHCTPSPDVAALPPHPDFILCYVTSVSFHADPKTSEVFAKITLDSRRRPPPLPPSSAQVLVSFETNLTASDIKGPFTAPVGCAERVFPQVNRELDNVSQTISVRDVHGTLWEFDHKYRKKTKGPSNTISRGWRDFVKKEKLIARDIIVFVRNIAGELVVGFRRAANGGGRVMLEAVGEAVRRSEMNQPFQVVYYPIFRELDFMDETPGDAPVCVEMSKESADSAQRAEKKTTVISVDSEETSPASNPPIEVTLEGADDVQEPLVEVPAQLPERRINEGCETHHVTTRTKSSGKGKRILRFIGPKKLDGAT